MAASWPERLTVGILGLGLMGGSAAKALKAKTRHRVLVFDREPESSGKGSFGGQRRRPFAGALRRALPL